MKLYLVALHDTRAEEFSPPMCTHTLGTAERLLTDIANNPESPVHKHPEDYQLLHVGYFDTATGEVEATHPRMICTASQVTAQKE